MKEAKLVPIEITDGEITGIQIDCETKDLHLSFNVSLIDNYGKKITTITIGTRSWCSIGNLKISTKSYALVGELLKELKICAIQHMNVSRKIIESKP